MKTRLSFPSLLWKNNSQELSRKIRDRAKIPIPCLQFKKEKEKRMNKELRLSTLDSEGERIYIYALPVEERRKRKGVSLA